MQNKKQNWFSKLFKKIKPESKNLIKIYAVYHCSKETYKQSVHDMSPAYYAKSREDALEAISRLIFQQNYSHFCMWVDLHPEILKEANLKIDDKNNYRYKSEAWVLYLATRFGKNYQLEDDSNLYTVVAVYYDVSDIATFLRILTASQPLGMTGEKEEEITNFNILHATAPTVKYGNIEVIESFVPFMESDPSFKEKVLRNSATVNSIFKKINSFEKEKKEK